MPAAARSLPRRLGLAVFSTLLITLVLPSIAQAQQGGPGFLFKRPIVSLTVRAGYSVPSAGSEIFDDARDLFTVGGGDFNAAAFGGDLAVRVSERIDIGAGMMYTRSNARSEYRDWVGVDDLPIEQETRFTRVPLTANMKYYLMDRGRSVGNFAWIPAQWSPYIGAGGGYMWYRFEQSGEFIDYETIDDPEGAIIFADAFEFDGWTPTAQVMAGADFSLSPQLVLNGEARYGWASAPMGFQFEGFDDLDLAGFQATVGLSVRF